ncbi:MAG TPA: type ISP restriction/modification enzyme, partial [Ktedonobacteraceae bacterium]|nr:type ISP restriction/modification enzyme [Ktedonobacteraceae bacterium]
TDFNLFRRGGHNLFPLYLYDLGETSSCKANLAGAFIEECIMRLGLKWVPCGHGDLVDSFGPEDIFAYLYALFYSPAYRERYAPFLKIDFPRVPITSNILLFRELCALGSRLVRLHLKEKHIQSGVAFPISGTNAVINVYYETPGRVWINESQYFDGVQWGAWNFSIGGYKVCMKWLKDRKGQTLSNDDLAHYQQIVAILAETNNMKNAIDAAIERYGGFPL